MENFDGVGRWRTKDHGLPIDASGKLFNGATVDGITGLRQMIVNRPDVFVGVMTEKMLTYAVGRGITNSDMPTVRKIVQERGSGLPFLFAGARRCEKHAVPIQGGQ
jgi:hypothetical protein